MNQADSRTRGKFSPREAKRFRRDSLTFLIRLAETDPVALVGSDQPGDLINLVWGFWRFAWIGIPGETLDAKRAEARKLVEEIRAKPEMLAAMVDGVKRVLVSATGRGHDEFQFLPETKMCFHRTPEGWVHSILWSPGDDRGAGLRQVGMYVAVTLIATEEGQMVRRCARKPCRRFFLATRPKQIFCGRKCASAAVFERYKQALGHEAYKAKHRETARHSYRVRRRRQGHRVKPRIQETTAKGAEQ
jgi:hypothetical protein